MRNARNTTVMALAGSLFAALGGCRATAPIYLWQPPAAVYSSNRIVALSPLSGPPELAARLEQSLADSVPFESANIQLITPDSLARQSQVTLVGAIGVTSDLAALHAARQSHADILLLGEVLSQPRPLEPGGYRSGQPTVPIGGPGKSAQLSTSDGRLAVAWRVLDVPTGETLATETLVVDPLMESQEFPELEFVPGDPLQKMAHASAKQTWQLLAPTVQRRYVRLAKPLAPLGAVAVRQGNALALAGRWPEAEQAWQVAHARNPWSMAARHNLALAAAAREDFAAAREHAQAAAAAWPSARFQQSYILLEQQRWLYHQAFGLPDPPDGWPLKALDPLPMEPSPEGQWTVWGWLTQPIPMPWD